ncbi:MAG: hypothetical protein FWF98_01730 [Dehalococcoidia bacterium]|nr:hypothetical protein [Dehalococcoidia bacterium]
MKHIKKGLLFFLVSCFLLSSAAFPTSADNADYPTSPDCRSIANYVEKNLGLFVEDYNSGLNTDEKLFSASYVEFKREIILVESGDIAIYLDFDGDNGYMLLGDNYVGYAFEIEGDLEYLRNIDEIYFYSVYDKFMFVQNGELIPAGIEFKGEDFWDDFNYGVQWAGQDPPGGAGLIYNLPAYMLDRYDAGYLPHESNTLSGFILAKQYDLSTYYKINGNVSTSEGNCVLSSIYVLLNYWRYAKGYSSFPSTSSNYNPINDYFYTQVVNDGWTPHYPNNTPDLYLTIRSMAVNNHGYKTGGVSAIDMVIEEAAAFYGYNALDASKRLTWSFGGEVVNQINAGRPSLWNPGFGTYGSHSTVCYGYEVYRKTTRVLFVDFYTYVHLMKLNDNWNSTFRYFDYDAYVNGDGIYGTFVTMS